MIYRLIKWLKKPKNDKKKAIANRIKKIFSFPFYFGKASLKTIFFASHPEFKILFKRFIKYNKPNNVGDITRLWSFILNIKQVLDEKVDGDFAELGVWRGNTASILAYYSNKSNRQTFLFDTYEGFNKKDLDGIDSDKSIDFDNTSLAMVKDVIGEDSTVCEFVKGYFPDSILDKHRSRKYAVVSLDCDLYEPMVAGLNFFYPLMSQGALFLLHDYSSQYWNGSKKAIDEFCKKIERI